MDTHTGITVVWMKRMSRKNLEIALTSNHMGFKNPNVKLEQYITPPRVAANLIQRAYELGDIQDKDVIELCAGTGMLSIAAALYGAIVTAVEIDKKAIEIMTKNVQNNQVDIKIIQSDALKFSSEKQFDIAIMNPPFGIQQKKYRDVQFIKKGHELAKVVYSIVDGSPQNEKNIANQLKDTNINIVESYLDEFPLETTYPWHKFKRKIHTVLILRTTKT